MEIQNIIAIALMVVAVTLWGCFMAKIVPIQAPLLANVAQAIYIIILKL